MDFNTPETAIRQAEFQLQQAMRQSDVRQLDALLHPDLRFMLPNGQILTKAMDLDAYASGSMVLADIQVQIHSIQLLDDLAIVISQARLKGALSGQPIQGHYQYLRIWKRQGDQYQVIGGSCVLL